MKSKAKAGPYYKLGNLEARDPEGHNNDGDNNDANDKGVHDSPFSRTVNSYPDGIGAFPATDGLTTFGPPIPIFPPDPANLPNARDVSDAVMDQGTADIPNTFGTNEFFQFFGQALTHDIAEAATGATGDTLFLTAGLFPPIPFGRTPYEGGTGPGDPRQQINEETSFLDLSMVYGNSQTMLDLVRAELRDKVRQRQARLERRSDSICQAAPRRRRSPADDQGGRHRLWTDIIAGPCRLPARRLRRSPRSNDKSSARYI
jgi:hypothetical protein